MREQIYDQLTRRFHRFAQMLPSEEARCDLDGVLWVLAGEIANQVSPIRGAETEKRQAAEPNQTLARR